MAQGVILDHLQTEDLWQELLEHLTEKGRAVPTKQSGQFDSPHGKVGRFGISVEGRGDGKVSLFTNINVNSLGFISLCLIICNAKEGVLNHAFPFVHI